MWRREIVGECITRLYNCAGMHMVGFHDAVNRAHELDCALTFSSHLTAFSQLTSSFDDESPPVGNGAVARAAAAE